MGESFIYKYPLEPDGAGVINILMPVGARLLTVQVQRGQPCLWALVEPSGLRVLRRLKFIGTGHPIDNLPAAAPYIGTFQLDDVLVFHLFDLGEFPQEW